MQNTQVLVVNQQPNVCQRLFDSLASEFNVISAYNGQQAMALSEVESPGIVLLDGHLTDTDSLDLCRHLKSKPIDAPSVVMFFDDENEQQVLDSYSAGADDYLLHNNQDAALLEKLKHIRYFSEEKDKLKNQADFASKTAFQSMGEASQYGTILQFIKSSFFCQNIDQLVDAFFECMQALQLRCAIQVRQYDGVETYSACGNKASDIEEEVLLLLKEKGRIFDFNQRTVINDHHVSILIRNMPVDDEALYGRIRDTVAILVEGFEARVISFQEENAIKTVLNELVSSIHHLDSLFDSHEEKTIDVMDRLMVDMRHAFDTLALTETQEKHFTGLVENSMEKLISLHIEGRSIEDEFEKILDVVKKSLS